MIEAFLAHAGWRGAARRLLAADASFRRYDRVIRAEDRAVLMDAPPPRENVQAFLAVARALLDLSQQPQAKPRSDGIAVEITRLELGRIVGCSREMASRVPPYL